jgi:N-acetylneuraminic acid mutarotase
MMRLFPKLRLSHLFLVLVLAFAGIALSDVEGSTAAGLSQFAAPFSVPASGSFENNNQNSTSSSTGVWTVTGSLHEARSNHTATLLQNGKVLVAGGYGSAALASAELYDPATNLWSFTGPLANVRFQHTATLLANGKVLVAGGRNASNVPVKTAELYDPAAGSWTTVGSFLEARYGHTATLLQNGKVLIVGGIGNSGSMVFVEVFDPASNTWTTAQTLHTARSFHQATLLPDGRLLASGGLGVSDFLSSVEIYNPGTNTWSNAASLLTGRGYHQAILLGNGKVLVAGGAPDAFHELASAELYDPVGNNWFPAESMGFTRESPTATLLQDGRTLIAGTTFGSHRTSEVYDRATNTWIETPDSNFDLISNTATLLQNGKVLVAGGIDGNQGASTAELYDPAAAASPGGPRIVFGTSRHGGNHDIYSMELDGSDQLRLTTSLAYDDQPKWSPDSSKIAFMSGRDGNFEIYTMNADGTAQTRVTNNPFADGFPAWSPDGTKIAFVRGNLNDPSTFEIYVMNANGSNEVRLTNDSAIDGVPSWSPDGTKIVFMSGGSSIFNPNSFEIYVVNADGSNRTRLTNNSVVDGQPSYSPDGTKILFASGDALNPNGIEIYVMNTDGSSKTRLTNNNVTDGFPAWSFDGSNIVFASGNVNDETGVELFVMNANGASPAKLTINTELDWFPDWQHTATPPSQIQMFASSTAAFENIGTAAITVTRTGNASGMASIGYATSDTAGANTCDAVTGVASARCDYETTVGRIDFAPGETFRTITISLVDDAYAEGTESFTVTLSNPRGSGVSLGAPTSCAVNVSDNETVTGANPIDNADARFFVRQHYLDFLNREPDSDGLAFWTDQITSCDSDTQCIEIRRINVSAAFFLSIEFQETGYLVYRMYKVAYNPPGVPVPVRFDEFMADSQQIAKGVVVGQTNWEQTLETNKQNFAAEFVVRLRFTQDHPTSRTPAQFVDDLFVNAGVTPSAAERTSLMGEFGTATNTADTAARARVVRRISDNTTLKQQELNKAFVLMQYFGYLRRNPFDPPETTLDFQGYNFWLNKLNQFNGNFVNAEMVKAFIVSAEYRHRFGP